MKTRKVPTVSEANQMLIRKGYKSGYSISINKEDNPWGADTLSFGEYNDGHSVLGLYKFHQSEGCSEGSGNLLRVAHYRKLKVDEKWAVISIIALLPKVENKN